MAESRAVRRTEADWNQVAAEDPMWGILSSPQARGGKWDEEAFFATGVREVAEVTELLRRHGFEPPCEVAVDFGAGMGRLTRPLSDYARSVVGIDVSEEMVRLATKANPRPDRIRFVHSASERLPLESASCDLVLSLITLQHVEPSLALSYISEFSRVLRPGGFALFQLARREPEELRGPRSLYRRLLPARARQAIRRRFLSRDVPWDMYAIGEAFDDADVAAAVAAEGGRIVARVTVPAPGGWLEERYVVVKTDGAR